MSVSPMLTPGPIVDGAAATDWSHRVAIVRHRPARPVRHRRPARRRGACDPRHRAPLLRRPDPPARRQLVRGRPASRPASWPRSSARSACWACTSRATAAPAPARRRTGWPAWSWRPPTAGSGAWCPCRDRSRCSRSSASAATSRRSEWLPRMAAGEAIGCFGLTEPDFGSEPGGMRTRAQARRRRLGAQRHEDVDHQRRRSPTSRSSGRGPTTTETGDPRLRRADRRRRASRPRRSSRRCRCARR